MRDAFYLPTNRSAALPQSVIILDTESRRVATSPNATQSFDTLRLWYATHWRYERGTKTRRTENHGTDKEGFWAYLDHTLSVHRVTWLVAHSAGFDWQLLGGWCRIDDGTYDHRTREKADNGLATVVHSKRQTPIVCTEDPPFILRVYRRTDQATLVVVDTVNYWPMRLAEIGELIGMPKLTMPQESDPDEAWLDYCRNDCRILECAFTQYCEWVHQNDLGMFRFTSAGQAQAAFRHRFMSHKIVVHQDPEPRKLERAGYYGGQTDCFTTGVYRGPVYYCDVSSLFPSVMAERSFPVRRIVYDDRTTAPVRIPPCIPIDRSIATVTVAADSRTYPVRDDGCTKYAVGTYRTTLCGPELYDAYVRGEILLWHCWAGYETAPIFAEFVRELWRMRSVYDDCGSRWYATMCKSMMNSLYGKFGQWAAKWEEIPGLAAWPRWGKHYVKNVRTGEFDTYRHIAGAVYRQTGRAEHPRSVPSIAAFVTAYAREKMRGLRELAGPDHVLYQCVDALMLTQPGFDRLNAAGLIRDRELGYLRLTAQYDSVDIRGSNFYRRNGEWVCSGVNTRVVDVSGNTWSVEVRERTNSIIDREPSHLVCTDRRVHTVRPGDAAQRSDWLGRVPPPVVHNNCAELRAVADCS